MIAVIADDITGAAEIAGIGLRFGQRVSLVTDVDVLPDCDLVVCATDTRSMSQDDAVAVSRNVARKLVQAGCTNIFKKTDSALRGHVVAELRAIMAETHQTKALYLPENPSRGRIIRDGIYYIDDTPIDHTSFSYDPEFPACTANVKERLGEVVVINTAGEINGEAIFVANATCWRDVASYAVNLNAGILPAGAADFFAEYLEAKGWQLQGSVSRFGGFGDRNALVICGSTLSGSLSDYDYIKRKSIISSSMPLEVFEGGDPREWIEELIRIYKEQHSLIFAVGHPSKGGKEFALRLRCVMADVAAELIGEMVPQELVIEGGATTFAIMERLGWSNFNITDEVAPGVVRMSLNGSADTHITLKPGSYPWGDRLFM